MSLATNVFPCLPAGFLVWKQMHDLRRKLFLLAAVPMWEAYAKEFFFFSLSNTTYERSWTIIFFFIYVLDIWMEMIYDLVTNGLARLNLPLELNFLCIGLCQKILVLWFFMHYVHENVVVGIDLWWFPYIVQKNCDFSWFSKTLFSILLHVLWLKYSRSWKRTLRWSMKMLHVLRWKKSVYFRSWKRTLAWLQDWTLDTYTVLI